RRAYIPIGPLAVNACRRPTLFTAFSVSCCVFTGLHDDLAQRWMGMDQGVGEFVDGESVADRRGEFVDQHRCLVADDVRAEDLPGIWVGEDFGEAVIEL